MSLTYRAGAKIILAMKKGWDEMLYAKCLLQKLFYLMLFAYACISYLCNMGILLQKCTLTGWYLEVKNITLIDCKVWIFDITGWQITVVAHCDISPATNKICICVFNVLLPMISNKCFCTCLYSWIVSNIVFVRYIMYHALQTVQTAILY